MNTEQVSTAEIAELFHELDFEITEGLGFATTALFENIMVQASVAFDDLGKRHLVLHLVDAKGDDPTGRHPFLVELEDDDNSRCTMPVFVTEDLDLFMAKLQDLRVDLLFEEGEDYLSKLKDAAKQRLKQS